MLSRKGAPFRGRESMYIYAQGLLATPTGEHLLDQQQISRGQDILANLLFLLNIEYISQTRRTEEAACLPGEEGQSEGYSLY